MSFLQYFKRASWRVRFAKPGRLASGPSPFVALRSSACCYCSPLTCCCCAAVNWAEWVEWDWVWDVGRGSWVDQSGWVASRSRHPGVGGKTFISAHLFFYSTYNICQKQDTHPHGHILDIYFVLERPATDERTDGRTDSERVSVSITRRSRSGISGLAGSPDG